jgi:hypothetical protein
MVPGKPRDGYGYLAALPRQTLMDDISNEEWEITMLSPTQEECPYVGTAYIDTALCDVWYSQEEGGFIAQVRLS